MMEEVKKVRSRRGEGGGERFWGGWTRRRDGQNS